jgi:hypothetical protein
MTAPIAAAPIGPTWYAVAGPIVVVLALALWLVMLVLAGLKKRYPEASSWTVPHRGPITGGMGHGGPAWEQGEGLPAEPAEPRRSLAREDNAPWD